MFNKEYKVEKDDFGDIYVFSEISEHANLIELDWREKLQFDSDARYDAPEKWQKIYSDGRFGTPDKIRKIFKIKGKVLDLGTGSGWLAAYISKYEEVDEVYALDFSTLTLKENFPRIANWIGCDKDKIKRIVADFHLLPFKDNSLDVVLCDAALHHSDNPVALLKEIKRILKKGGSFAATSEPIASKWREKSQKKHFGAEEKKLGITENIYSMKEWKEMFSQAGIGLEVKPYFFTENTKGVINFLKNYTPLRMFNGLLFSNYIMYFRKEQ
ncbi:class I SAM-dependent methyltransferase [bacterium]|nr:class I SAM-dependent methyltransferase [bacterium]